MEQSPHPSAVLEIHAKTWNIDVTSEKFAEEMDKVDPLREYRSKFHIPRVEDIAQHGDPETAKQNSHLTGESVYFTGNSLGLQPKKARQYIEEDLETWKKVGVIGHFTGKHPWLTIDECVTKQMAKIVGANESEIAVMNTLTVNLHLMMVHFYRPTATRHKILIEDNPFPSDWYATESQIHFHGFDPKESLVKIAPRPGEYTIRHEDIVAKIKEGGFALIMLPGVQFSSGQYFDLKAITEGALVGFDLAHAVGNVPVKLHDWNVDFAVWCSYKYLNSGAGGIGGCFVHERHANDTENPRFAGWWGHNLKTRFGMQDAFDPIPGAFGYRLSNPPVFPILSLLSSVELFDEIGIEKLREKSILLTGYLEKLIDTELKGLVTIDTPREIERRGAQLSIRFCKADTDVKLLEHKLYALGVVPDARGPILRVGPAPLYNSFKDAWAFVQRLRSLLIKQ